VIAAQANNAIVGLLHTKRAEIKNDPKLNIYTAEIILRYLDDFAANCQNAINLIEPDDPGRHCERGWQQL
jgi:hypothetical protein